MISAMFADDGRILLVSKNGPTDLSVKIEEALNMDKNCDWTGLCRKWLAQNFTPTFEWVDPDQPIVLVYPKRQLSLIAIRCIQTGRYLTQ